MPKLLEPPEAPSPWLEFFRRVRVLAAKLDALETNGNGPNENQEECRETART